MNRALLIGIPAVVLLGMYAADKFRQFKQSINFYITSLGFPRFAYGYLEVPTKLSFINHSMFPIAVDAVLINFYQWTGTEWSLLGTSNPQKDKIYLNSNNTTEVTLKPRVAIVQGLLPGILNILKGNGREFRLGVAIRIAGQMMPEQFKEFSLGASLHGFEPKLMAS